MDLAVSRLATWRTTFRRAQFIARRPTKGKPGGELEVKIPTKHSCRPQGLIMLYDRAGRFRVLRV